MDSLHCLLPKSKLCQMLYAPAQKKFHLPRARGFLAWHYARAARADSAQSDYCQYRSKKMRTPIRAQIQRVSSRKVPSTVSPSTGSARRASFLCFLEFSEIFSPTQFFQIAPEKKSGIPAPLPPISILKIAPKKAAIYKNRKCGRRHNPAARAKFPKTSADAASS